MRKQNPADICDGFRTEITDLQTFLINSWEAASSARDKSILAELVFHRSYVAVESFLSAWFIGAINRDTAQFIQFRKTSITQSVSTKFTAWDANQLSYTPRNHISLADLQKLIDPDEWNLTFTSCQNLKAKAGSWLTPAYRGKVDSVSAERQKIIDAARAIRHCVAHQSKRSFREMNSQLIALPNTGVCAYLRTRVQSVRNVGVYLKASVNSETRLELYLNEFWELGNDLS